MLAWLIEESRRSSDGALSNDIIVEIEDALREPIPGITREGGRRDEDEAATFMAAFGRMGG